WTLQFGAPRSVQRRHVATVTFIHSAAGSFIPARLVSLASLLTDFWPPLAGATARSKTCSLKGQKYFAGHSIYLLQTPSFGSSWNWQGLLPGCCSNPRSQFSLPLSRHLSFQILDQVPMLLEQGFKPIS